MLTYLKHPAIQIANQKYGDRIERSKNLNFFNNNKYIIN